MKKLKDGKVQITTEKSQDRDRIKYLLENKTNQITIEEKKKNLPILKIDNVEIEMEKMKKYWQLYGNKMKILI